MLGYETTARTKGYHAIAGVDEAGRGPLAGPVVAAAVILAPDSQFNGLDDSKKLSPKTREKFFLIIKEEALSYGIGVVGVEEIDKINILQASLLAMKHGLSLCPNDMSSHVTGATELYAGKFKFPTLLSNVANNPLSNL